MSWFFQLFSLPETSPPSHPESIPPSTPEPVVYSAPRLVVCGLLGNGVDGAAGDKITEDYIRWYHHFSSDPRYNSGLSSWLAVRPFEYTVDGEEITLIRNSLADCPPAIATKTFIDRVENVTDRLEGQDTLILVLVGLEDDPTYIFSQAANDYHQDSRRHPHARILLTALETAFIHHYPSDVVAPLALRSHMLHYLGSCPTFRASDSPPPPLHHAMHDIPFLTQPSSKEIDVAILDTYTQKLYNTRWDTSEEEISSDELQACYTDISNISDLMSPSFKYPLELFFNGKMTEEEKAHFLDVYREFKRQRAAYRCMAEDLGLWKPPVEGEVMSTDDNFMVLRASLRSGMSFGILSKMVDLGLNSEVISMQTRTSPPYRDPPMWLARQWVSSGKPLISREEWLAAAQRAIDGELKYVGTHSFDKTWFC